MDPAYGIGTDNRYALFCLDDDTSDATGAAIARKAKIARKAAAKAAAAAAEKENKATAALAAQQAAAIAERQLQQQHEQRGGGGGGKQARNNDGQRRAAPIRDSQNIRSGAGVGAPREAGDKPAFERRPPVNGEQRFNRRPNADGSVSTGGADSRPPRRTNNGPFVGGGDRKQIGGAGGGRPFEGRQREFDRKSGSDKTGVKAVDKRDGGGAHNWGTHKQDIEDLQNGATLAGGDASDASDKETEKSSAVAAVGTEPAVNGGDAATTAVAPAAADKPQTAEQIAAAAAAAEAQRLAEEEARELTLDEWKAQRGVRAKPQFNIRKAGEGEDTSQWKQMVALQSRKKGGKNETDSDEELEYDPSMYPQRVGRQKHLLDIEFHFNDGRRGGLNSRKGPGGPGGPRQGGDRPSGGDRAGRPVGGGGAGFPGGRPPRRDQQPRSEQQQQQDAAAVAPAAAAPAAAATPVAVEASVAAAPVAAAAVAAPAPQVSFGGDEQQQQQRPERKPRAPRNDEHQQRRRPAYEDRQPRGGYASFGGQHAAPKVDDERAFPSLG